MDTPVCGDWADADDLPLMLQGFRARYGYSETEGAWARRHFYALCTHIDQQIGHLIGTIREEGILDNTVILFTSDHGETMGNHGIWAKQNFYESSTNVPMLLMGAKDCHRVGHGRTDDRLVCLADIMPTVLDLANITIPETVTGKSMMSASRDHIYGEFGEGEMANRMIRHGSHKLIYYPAGNHCQLFDLGEDPYEQQDLARDPAKANVLAHLKGLLISELYGSDLTYITDGSLTGLPNRRYRAAPNRGLGLTRGHQWPVPPVNPGGKMVFFPELPEDEV